MHFIYFSFVSTITNKKYVLDKHKNSNSIKAGN